MSSLQVLCPNGRRQNVKTTPNTKLLQVLEEVCQKQKFLPSEDYKLVHNHGRTTLDLTLSVRFANLANNAKLELVKSEKSRAESEVVIALQLENGERLQHAFSPLTTLWDILQHWETVSNSMVPGQLTSVDGTSSPALHPVCIYMTEDYCGEMVLKNTPLRKLGLVGGRAVIRYIKRPVDDKVINEATQKITKQQQQKGNQDKNAIKRQVSNSDSTCSDNRTLSTSSVTETQSNSPNTIIQNTVIETQSGTTMETQSGTRINASTSDSGNKEMATISLNINVNIQNDTKPTVKDAAGSEEPASKMVKTEHAQDLSEPMEVEHTDVPDTVMETEDSVKEPAQPPLKDPAKPPASSVPYGQNQREAAESLRNMNVPGLEIFTPDDFLDLPPDQQQVAQQLAAALLPKLLGRQMQNKKPQQKPVKALPPPTQTGFSGFKFPEETKGKQLYKNELNEYKKEDFMPCDRNTVVYSLLEKQEDDGDDCTALVKTEDLPEEFFNLTESDIRSLMTSQKKKLDELENQPLMTSTMKKAKLESIYSRYERVVIRIQFTDKLVLQGFFKPRETVFAVQKFVKEHLKNKDTPFYLYTSPPKCVLKDESQTLIEAHLVPASIVYFGSSQQEDHFLSDTSLSSLKSKIDADILVAECLRSSEFSNEDGSPSTSSGKGKQPMNSRAQPKTSDKPSTSACGEQSSTGSGSKPVPKWFKTGKK